MPDLTFDGYQAPSFLQAAGAKDVGVEFFSLSKSYNMPGWRVGFCVGNKEIVHALARIKSYLDYGIFQPIQIAAIQALDGPQDCVDEICSMYRNGATLCSTASTAPVGIFPGPRARCSSGRKFPSRRKRWARWSLQILASGSPGGGLAGYWLRPIWRRACALRID